MDQDQALAEWINGAMLQAIDWGTPGPEVKACAGPQGLPGSTDDVSFSPSVIRGHTDVRGRRPRNGFTLRSCRLPTIRLQSSVARRVP